MHKSRVDDATSRSTSLAHHYDCNAPEGSEVTCPAKHASSNRFGSSSTIDPNARKLSSRANHHRRGGNSTVILTPATTTKAQPKRPSSSPSPLPALITTLPPSAGSYFAWQPGASSIEARSPTNKRPPASRSSHGIETSHGPPPALSTQRTYSKESTWRLPPSDDTLIEHQLSPARILSKLDACSGTETSYISSGLRGTRVPKADGWSEIHLPATNGLQSTSVVTDSKMIAATDPSQGTQDVASQDERDCTVRALEGENRFQKDLQQNITIEGKLSHEEGNTQLSQEDLFLNLAHADEASQQMVDPTSQSERRRSRITLLSSRQPLQNGTSSSSSTSQPMTSMVITSDQDGRLARAGGPLRGPAAGQSSPAGSVPVVQRASPRDRQYAASAHPLDQQHRPRLSDVTPKASFMTTRGIPSHDVSPEASQAYGRRPSIPESTLGIPSRKYRQSNLSFSNSGLYHSSPFTGRSAPIFEQDSTLPTQRAEGTESTVSTTAPSTVWDELDDLKSRIRKLELTGKLPSSSGAAISTATGDRPHTATTTVTTMSPSPHRGRGTASSPEESALDGPSTAQIHPLLHSALAKSKPLINPSVFKALEATATDALILAAMTGYAGQNGQVQDTQSGHGTAGVLDRRLRRKADSMCRSLTELCIMLSEDLPNQGSSIAQAQRDSRSKGSADGRQQREGSAEEGRFQRGSSHEPDTRSSSSIFSRLEARRTSMLGVNGPNHVNNSPKDRSPEIATPIQPVTPITSTFDRNSTVLLRSRRNDADDAEKSGPSISRAMTSLGDARSMPRQQPLREYTSQYPLLSSDQRSPTVQSSLPVRRTYFSALSHTPSTPTVQPGSRRYLDRSTPSSADSSRLAEARQQRLASLGQHPSIGRQRANSLSRKLRHASADLTGQEGEPGFR